MRRLALIAAVLGFALAPSTAAAAATTTTEIEGEVMCPVCGTLLELAESPQAKREKAYVARLVAQGRSKAEIKDALVEQYGSSVLALPEASGFDLAAYLVPIGAFLVAAVGAAFGVKRWRGGASRPGTDEVPPGGPSGDDAERLEADLSRYDL